MSYEEKIGTYHVKQHYRGGALPFASDQYVEHRVNGVLHNEYGPAIKTAGGDEFWYLNGVLHRIGAPACIYADGDQYWYNNGKRHRLNGPAVQTVNGYDEYYINGELLTKQEFISRKNNY